MKTFKHISFAAIVGVIIFCVCTKADKEKDAREIDITDNLPGDGSTLVLKRVKRKIYSWFVDANKVKNNKAKKPADDEDYDDESVEDNEPVITSKSHDYDVPAKKSHKTHETHMHDGTKTMHTPQGVSFHHSDGIDVIRTCYKNGKEVVCSNEGQEKYHKKVSTEEEEIQSSESAEYRKSEFGMSLNKGRAKTRMRPKPVIPIILKPKTKSKGNFRYALGKKKKNSTRKKIRPFTLPHGVKLSPSAKIHHHPAKFINSTEVTQIPDDIFETNCSANGLKISCTPKRTSITEFDLEVEVQNVTVKSIASLGPIDSPTISNTPNDLEKLTIPKKPIMFGAPIASENPTSENPNDLEKSTVSDSVHPTEKPLEENSVDKLMENIKSGPCVTESGKEIECPANGESNDKYKRVYAITSSSEEEDLYSAEEILRRARAHDNFHETVKRQSISGRSALDSREGISKSEGGERIRRNPGVLPTSFHRSIKSVKKKGGSGGHGMKTIFLNSREEMSYSSKHGRFRRGVLPNGFYKSINAIKKRKEVGVLPSSFYKATDAIKKRKEVGVLPSSFYKGMEDITNKKGEGVLPSSFYKSINSIQEKGGSGGPGFKTIVLNSKEEFSYSIDSDQDTPTICYDGDIQVDCFSESTEQGQRNNRIKIEENRKGNYFREGSGGRVFPNPIYDDVKSSEENLRSGSKNIECLDSHGRVNIDCLLFKQFLSKENDRNSGAYARNAHHHRGKRPEKLLTSKYHRKQYL